MQDTQFKNELIDIDLEGKTLPAVTAADEGKVLGVNPVYTKGDVIVPEQTVTCNADGEGTLLDVVESLVVANTICYVTLDGIEYMCTIVPDLTMPIVNYDIYINYSSDTLFNTSGNHTISVYKAEASSYTWTPVPTNIKYVRGMDTQLEMTWQEIRDAIASGTFLFMCTEGEARARMCPIYVAYEDSGSYYVYGDPVDTSVGYVTDSPDGYPAFFD